MNTGKLNAMIHTLRQLLQSRLRRLHWDIKHAHGDLGKKLKKEQKILQDELKHITQGPEIIALGMSLNEITPELKMLSEKIEISDLYYVGAEGPGRAKYMRGLVLVDDYKSADTGNDEGKLSGHCLVLTPDGEMIQMKRAGSRESEWKTCPRAMTLTTAIAEHGFDRILQGLVAVIERKIDDAKPQRAARLQKCLAQIEKNKKWCTDARPSKPKKTSP